MDSFENLWNVYVAGYGDPEQMRDVKSFEGVVVHVGNKADIYCTAPYVNGVAELTVDADKEHSDDKEVPKTTAYNHNSLGTKEKPLISNQQFKTACERLKGGEIDIYEKTLNAFTLDATQKTLFEKLKSQLKTA